MSSIEENPIVPMHEVVAEILKDKAPHITEKDIETYFSEQDKQISATGSFNPDTIQRLKHADIISIYEAEDEVLRRCNLIK